MSVGQDCGWLRPDVPVDPGQPEPRATAAVFELRPLSLGEILDRTFALYRSRFWLFACISMVAASFHVVVQAVSLATAHTIWGTVMPMGPTGPLPKQPPLVGHTFVMAEVRSWIAALVFLLVSAITQAATSLAMSQVYLNRPATAKESLGVAVKRWYRWIGIALWQACSFLWVPLVVVVPAAILAAYATRSGNPVLTGIALLLLALGVFGGVPVGVMMYLRNALAVPAAMVEGLRIRPAMRRSKALAAGTKGRIFVVLLIASALYWVVGVIESPAAVLMMLAPRQQHYIAQAITLVISFVGHTVVAPVALIGLTMVYFDQRVRKEALDIQLLLEQTRSPGLPPIGAEGGAIAPVV